MATDGVGAPAAGRLVVVAGSGRSGTSAATGVLKQLGLHVPQPEVKARAMNPRGFFEPVWVVRFHQRLLRAAEVSFNDARPEAFALAARVGRRSKPQAQLRRWLAEQVVVAPEVIVKDPRNAWFLPLWEHCAQQVGVTPVFLTMLRHPVEVLSSKDARTLATQSHAGKRGPGREQRRYKQSWAVANWVNLALFTEVATRDSDRAFLRYTDLLADWRGAISSVATTLDLSMRDGVDPDRARAVDDFLDPGLRRAQGSWDEVDVSPRLRDLAEEVWRELSRLSEAGGRRLESEAVLDEQRGTYVDLYAECEAVADSSILMARRKARKEARKVAAAEQQLGSAGSALTRARRVAGRTRGLARRVTETISARRGAEIIELRAPSRD